MMRPRSEHSAPTRFFGRRRPLTEWAGALVADLRRPSGKPAQRAERITLGPLMLLLVITGSALVLRFHNIDQWGMWIDELYSVQHAAEITDGHTTLRSLAYWPTLISLELAGVDMSSIDPQEWGTWRAAGIGEWNMRAHVALLGAVTILILGLVGYRTLGVIVTLLLCLLLALAPWHLWMSQVCRFYMQLFLFYNAGLLLYYQAVEEEQLRRAVLAMICVVLAFYTTPIALMIVGVFGVDLIVSLLRGRSTGMRVSFWAVGLAGLALCGASIVQNLTQKPDWYSSFVGTPQPVSIMTMGMIYLVGAPMVVMSALGVWSLLRAGRERLAILLVASILVPIGAFAMFDLAGRDVHLRYTFVGLFAWLILAAAGMELIIVTMLARWGALPAGLPIAALLSTYAVSDYIYMTGGAGYRGQWRQALAYVAEHRRPGEAVGGDHVGRQMARYYLGESDAVRLPRDFSPSDMRELMPGPAWIVIRAYEPSAGDRSADVEAAGQLRAYFANRIAAPNHTINVYYYTPPG